MDNHIFYKCVSCNSKDSPCFVAVSNQYRQTIICNGSKYENNATVLEEIKFDEFIIGIIGKSIKNGKQPYNRFADVDIV